MKTQQRLLCWGPALAACWASLAWAASANSRPRLHNQFLEQAANATGAVGSRPGSDTSQLAAYDVVGLPALRAPANETRATRLLSAALARQHFRPSLASSGDEAWRSMSVNGSMLDEDISTINALIEMLLLAHKRLLEQRAKLAEQPALSRDRKRKRPAVADEMGAQQSSADHVLVRPGFGHAGYGPEPRHTRAQLSRRHELVPPPPPPPLGPHKRLLAHDLLHVERPASSAEPPAWGPPSVGEAVRKHAGSVADHLLELARHNQRTAVLAYDRRRLEHRIELDRRRHEHARRKHETRLAAAAAAATTTRAPEAGHEDEEAGDAGTQQQVSPEAEPNSNSNSNSNSSSTPNTEQAAEQPPAEQNSQEMNFNTDFPDLFPPGVLSAAEIEEMRRQQQQQSDEAGNGAQDEPEAGQEAQEPAQPQQQQQQQQQQVAGNAIDAEPPAEPRPELEQAAADQQRTRAPARPLPAPQARPGSKSRRGLEQRGPGGRKQQQQQQRFTQPLVGIELAR